MPEITSETSENSASVPLDGDYAPFGYGHPAHLPDPHAQYGFEPGRIRLLPVKRDRRWRVTG